MSQAQPLPWVYSNSIADIDHHLYVCLIFFFFIGGSLWMKSMCNYSIGHTCNCTKANRQLENLTLSSLWSYQFHLQSTITIKHIFNRLRSRRQNCSLLQFTGFSIDLKGWCVITQTYEDRSESPKLINGRKGPDSSVGRESGGNARNDTILAQFPSVTKTSLPESKFNADWLTVFAQPSSAVAWISICVHVKDPKDRQPYRGLDTKILHTLEKVALLLRLP